MRHIVRTDSRYGFYRPFFHAKRGHILGLASRIVHLRDDLALSMIARFFPLPEYDGILVEPARPTLQPADNVILVGSGPLFVRPDAHPISGPEPPLCVGEEKLGQRLRPIYSDCCYRLTVDQDRAVVNEVTGAAYRPERNARGDLGLDYGVIRRVYRGPTQNTIILEGVHRLGTLGAVMVATSQHYLDAIWEAVNAIEGFDEALPLEVLVRSTYEPGTDLGVFAPEAIRAVPLALVYNRRWVYDMTDGHRWSDQLPWDVHLRMWGEDPPAVVPPGTREAPAPRLEVQGDLRGLDPAVEKLCRRVLVAAGGPAREDEQLRLLELLTAEPDRFRIELVEETPWGAALRTVDLPQGHPTPIRRLRKQFLLLLVLCRALQRSFRRDRESIRRFLPRFRPGASAKPEELQFSATVAGKMQEGFEPLFGSARRPRHHAELDYSRKTQAYELRLGRAALVIKLRF
jgi:hypothetical protein